MASILHTPIPSRPLSRLEHVTTRPAKADLKEVEVLWRTRVGQAVARAFSLANLSQKEVAGLVNRDVAQVARWISGAERPQFDALFSVEILREPLVIALAALSDQIDITTQISIRRRA